MEAIQKHPMSVLLHDGWKHGQPVQGIECAHSHQVENKHAHQRNARPTQEQIRKAGHHDVVCKWHIVLQSFQPYRCTWSIHQQNWTMPGDSGPSTWPIFWHVGNQQRLTVVDVSKHLLVEEIRQLGGRYSQNVPHPQDFHCSSLYKVHSGAATP